MQSRRFLYICDDRFYHGSGSWHTGNGFPLRAIAESCAATGVHIASWTFFGRLSDGPPPVGALPIDAPPNTEVTVIGPRVSRPGIRSYLRTLPEYSKILRGAIRRHDVVCLKANFFAAWIAAAVMGRASGRTVFSHQVGDPANIAAGPRALRPAIRAIARTFTRSVHRASSVNVFVSRDLARLYGSAKPHWIYNECRLRLSDIGAAGPLSNRELNHPPHLIYVGRLSPEKGLTTLVDAVARLGVPVRASLAGSGPERDRLQQRIEKLGIASRVSFVGAIPWGPELFRFMQSADMLVLPSFTEGLPLVLIEALANGVPVVASRVGGVPELIEHGRTGLLFDPGDSEGLARAIATLIRDRDLRFALRQRGLQVARNNTLENQMCLMYQRLCSEILSRQLVPAERAEPGRSYLSPRSLPTPRSQVLPLVFSALPRRAPRLRVK